MRLRRPAISIGDEDRPDGGPAMHEAASYIGELSADLAALARRNGLDTLGYLLDMAKLEAERNLLDADKG